MANQSETQVETRVEELPSWSFMAFGALHGGKLKYVLCHHDDPETGEIVRFHSLAFIDDPLGNPSNGYTTFVGFSKKLGELTPEEVAAQSNELQVVLTSNGKYKLCRDGKAAWQDVAIKF